MRKYFSLLVLTVCVVMLSGCATSRNPKAQSPDYKQGSLQTRIYADEKPRVDQDMSQGNFGFISGEAKPEDRSGYKDTRTVYVFEMTKNVSRPVSVEAELEPVPDVKPVKVPPASKSDSMASQAAVALPAITQEPEEIILEEYTVLEGDTLQKISKKFYGNYSSWPKIFDQNKDVLKNPDRVKPGMVLQIPVQGGAEMAIEENLK